MFYTNESYIKSILYKRREDAHKGDFGKVLIYAGSLGMAGAAVLCGRAALKSGAGLVQYWLPELDTPLLPILQISVPEATCVTLAAGDYEGYTAIAAGSGLGTAPATRQRLADLTEHYRGILVLDADALNLIAADADLAAVMRASDAQVIITPHIGEAKRLLHTCAGIEGVAARKEAACALAQEYHCICVLKGSGTLVAVPLSMDSVVSKAQISQADCRDGNQGSAMPKFAVYQNTTGNPGMATAGSGDCLAGLITSLAAQGYAPSDAARIGVYIHGLAGDLAARELGEMGMTAGDIVSYIPYALKASFSNLDLFK